GTTMGSADSNCARAVRNQNAAGTGVAITGLDLSNCVVKNFVTTGYYLEKFSASPIAASGNYVRNNLFSNMRFRAVYAQCDIVATNNVITNVNTGIVVEQVGIATAPGFTPVISGNTITLANTGDSNRNMGICSNNRFGSAPLLNISSNVINGSASITAPGEAIRITSSTGGAQVHATNNVIDGAGTLSTGYWIWNTDSLSDVVVSGGTVSGVTANGVYLTDYDVRYSANSYMDGNFATLDSVAISTTASGKAVNVHWTGTGSNLGPCTLTVRNGVALSGAGSGMAMNGAKARVNFSGASPASFDSALPTYIVLSNAGATNPSTAVDATSATFGGNAGSSATLAQNFAIAAKVTDKADTAGLGLVTVKAANVYVNTGGSVALGLAAASASDTVNVQAGAYTDGALTVNTAGITVNSEAGVSGFSFVLGTANSMTLAGAGDVNATGNANANSIGTSAGANVINGLAGIDTAVIAGNVSAITGTSTISVGTDTLTNVELLAFA
ncbi:MAG: hypothetical protein EBY29_14750, partial [Planctomycetes bacterium]|nr:hypothetical protein [Planctomycetota bacterium]